MSKVNQVTGNWVDWFDKHGGELRDVRSYEIARNSIERNLKDLYSVADEIQYPEARQDYLQFFAEEIRLAKELLTKINNRIEELLHEPSL